MPGSAKHRIGLWLLPKLPVNSHVFCHARAELAALRVKALGHLHPGYRRTARALARQRGIKVNIGCGPFGEPGWVNLDAFGHPGVTMRADCRRRLPLAGGSCAGVHVEHFFEHLNPPDEVPAFLAECRRVLAPGGVVRVIVPDGQAFVRAYLADGWTAFEQIGIREADYATKMDALNHVFIQGYEHMACYDFETLADRLRTAGFATVNRVAFRGGAFPGGCIDREQHQPYSLYVEAVAPVIVRVTEP